MQTSYEHDRAAAPIPPKHDAYSYPAAGHADPAQGYDNQQPQSIQSSAELIPDESNVDDNNFHAHQDKVIAEPE